jgi:hypothetical protein
LDRKGKRKADDDLEAEIKGRFYARVVRKH